MRRLAAFLSIVLLLVTAQQMAVARGQATDAAGQVILCTGNGIISVTLDAQGKPVGPAHICPDCALSLVLAVASPDLPVRADLAHSLTFPPALARHLVNAPRSERAARDPPAAV